MHTLGHVPLSRPLPSVASVLLLASFGVFEDPWGVTWSISDSTNTIEDFPKELERTVMPFVSVKNAPGFLDFLGEVFGAEPAMEAAKEPGGKVRETGGSGRVRGVLIFAPWRKINQEGKCRVRT